MQFICAYEWKCANVYNFSETLCNLFVPMSENVPMCEIFRKCIAMSGNVPMQNMSLAILFTYNMSLTMQKSKIVVY